MMSDSMPAESSESIVTTKIKLLAGIAALKAGTFGYDQLCQFNEFVQLGLKFCEEFDAPEFQPPVYKIAAALVLIMERHAQRGIYAANGDELRALSEHVEAVCDFLGELPALAVQGMRTDIAMNEIKLRNKIAKQA
ncbi:hypothetical protein M0D69_13745 [Caballeronia sp. SEWSISQ10-4 2]|uniref:hypothetical protein n=1 Tax=Caballeronia sp. SEWSISQ10-4 2 TaxID=2937438 RepID=UPI00264A9901|nr:hypothetical protein [Caballeronia sp. SEWSISQ10-4 2]MDN7179056.1 hypothetical protein [Caballeronia sp. SEWSISQ10-4 2]